MPDLSTLYPDVHKRLQWFGVTEGTKDYCVRVLEDALEAMEKTGQPLPPEPGLFGFCDRNDCVELEWELPDRKLWLTVESGEVIEYSVEALNPHREAEGSFYRSELPAYLIWLMGGEWPGGEG